MPERKKVQPPRPGGRKVERQPGAGGRFFLFNEIGDTVEGYLAGTEQMAKPTGEMGERFKITLLTTGETKVLPDHVRLTELLQQVEDGNLVWICYEGEERIPNRPQPMKLYNVVDYGKTAPDTITHTTGATPATTAKPDTGVRPGSEMDKPAAAIGANDLLTDGQRQELIDFARDKGLTDDMLKNILHLVTGKPTTKGVTWAQRLQVEAAVVAKADELKGDNQTDGEDVSF